MCFSRSVLEAVNSVGQIVFTYSCTIRMCSIVIAAEWVRVVSPEPCLCLIARTRFSMRGELAGFPRTMPSGFHLPMYRPFGSLQRISADSNNEKRSLRCLPHVLEGRMNSLSSRLPSISINTLERDVQGKRLRRVDIGGGIEGTDKVGGEVCVGGISRLV